MNFIKLRIVSLPPESSHSNRGNIDGPKIWTDLIIDQARNLHKIKKAYILKVAHLLPLDKFPGNFPYSDAKNVRNGISRDNIIKTI